MARVYTGFRFVKTTNGSPPAMHMCNLKSTTASVYEGQLLRMSATSGSVACAAIAGTAIYGVAAANVTSSPATTKMPVYLADLNNVFEARGTLTSTARPNALVGKRVAIAGTVSTNYRIAMASLEGVATAPAVRVVGYNPGETCNGSKVTPYTSQTGVKYWVKFLEYPSLVDGDATVTH